MLKTTLALLLYCLMFFLPSCSWIATHKAQEEEIIKDAQDIEKQLESSMPIPHHWQQQKWSF
jgi:hypothetical protein